MKKFLAGTLAAVTIGVAILASIGSSLEIALQTIPEKALIELQLKPEIEGIATDIIAHHVLIQIGIWLLLFMPMIGITLLLRKDTRTLAMTLGVANLASGLLIALGVKNIRPIIETQLSNLQLEFTQPVIATVMSQMNTKAWIFIVVGTGLCTLAIIAHGKARKIEQKYIQERPKKKLKGILKRGSASRKNFPTSRLNNFAK